MNKICQKFASKIQNNIQNLLFLYEGKEVNFDLSFNSQANIQDRNKKEMTILVYNNKIDLKVCPKCRDIFKLNKEKAEDIILCNNKINEKIKRIYLQIENIIKSSSNTLMNATINNIKTMLDAINEDITNNNEKLFNLFNYKKNSIINSTSSNNKNIEKIELDTIFNENKDGLLLLNKNNSNRNSKNINIKNYIKILNQNI